MNQPERVPCLPLSEIREALIAAHDRLPDLECVTRCLETFEDIIRYRVGALVEYQGKNDEWILGVVVAHMVCEPRYICTPGDDRNRPQDPLLACPRKHLRPRGSGGC